MLLADVFSFFISYFSTLHFSSSVLVVFIIIKYSPKFNNAIAGCF